MSLQNQVVYIQFHPVAYMVKLNIEMCMARLITKLAKASIDDRVATVSSSNNHTAMYSRNRRTTDLEHQSPHGKAGSAIHTSVSTAQNPGTDSGEGIRTTKEVHVHVNHAKRVSMQGGKQWQRIDDEVLLAQQKDSEV